MGTSGLNAAMNTLPHSHCEPLAEAKASQNQPDHDRPPSWLICCESIRSLITISFYLQPLMVCFVPGVTLTGRRCRSMSRITLYFAYRNRRNAKRLPIASKASDAGSGVGYSWIASVPTKAAPAGPV